MIKTTRSRLEVRQEPGGTVSVFGFLIVAAAGSVAVWSVAEIVSDLASHGKPPLFPAIRLAASILLAIAGWLMLRGRARFVLDLDHRMVARYRGVGGGTVGSNRSWDLAEFAQVVLLRRERPSLWLLRSTPREIVCLRRSDGSDLELHSCAHGGAEIAARIADFTGLPYTH